MEHRWGDRRQVILRVLLRHPDQRCAAGRLTNISLSGAYVQTRSEFTVFSRIEVAFDAARHGLARLGPMRLQGRIVRRGKSGMGIEWEEFSPEELGKIVRVAASISLRRPQMEQTRSQRRGHGLWAPPMQGHIGP